MKVCRTCCGCNPATTVFTITVYGCFGSPNVLPGATVTVTRTGFGVVGSGTTDGSGVYTLGITAAGAYTYTVTSPGLSTVVASGFTATCGSPITTTGSFAPIGTTNVCCCNSRDYPPTLHLTTSAGTCTLTYLAGNWRGSQTVSVSAYHAPGGAGCQADCAAGSSVGSVSVNYSVTCTGGSPGILVGWGVFGCPNGPFDPDLNGNAGATWLPVTGVTSGCPAYGFANAGFLVPWSDPCGTPLPTTFTIPSTSTAGATTTPSPISGSAVLSL